MAAPQVTGQRDGFGKVEVVGLTAFIRDLRKGRDRGAIDAELKEANNRVAKLVILQANRIASGQGKMPRKAAASLETASTGTQVRVIGGGGDVPYFGGANFGSHRNTRRLIKAKGTRGKKRSRATIVRAGEDIVKVARRVESQRDPRSGRGVQLARTKGGSIKVIKGWNQFHEYRKNRDRFLYAAVRSQQEQISKYYLKMLENITGRPFPE